MQEYQLQPQQSHRAESFTKKFSLLKRSTRLGEISKSEYLAQKEALVRACDEITGRVTALESELEDERAVTLLHSWSVESLKQYAEIQTLTAEIVDTVLEQVTVFPGRRLDITWKFQDDFQRLMEQPDVPRI